MASPTDLSGKRGLVIGIANRDSIAYGCAAALRAQGASLAVTYLNEKAGAVVGPLATALGCELCLPLDVEQDGQLAALCAAVEARWGRLDFVIHSIAYAPAADLHGRVVDCSLQGFQQAMRVSCYSFLEVARAVEPLLREGGAILTMSFAGADRVVPHYNLMGPVKAALQSAVRYAAAELGVKGIRVHALSPGPIRTRAASGLAAFDSLLDDAAGRAPLRRVVSIDEVGALAAFLVSDAASGLTGNQIFVDAGYHVMA
jgi:enoyl-[acyl-carrier protein] reductase I